MRGPFGTVATPPTKPPIPPAKPPGAGGALALGLGLLAAIGGVALATKKPQKKTNLKGCGCGR